MNDSDGLVIRGIVRSVEAILRGNKVGWSATVRLWALTSYHAIKYDWLKENKARGSTPTASNLVLFYHGCCHSRSLLYIIIFLIYPRSFLFLFIFSRLVLNLVYKFPPLLLADVGWAGFKLGLDTDPGLFIGTWGSTLKKTRRS